MENETPNALAEDWELLMSFFPADWREQAQTCGALKGLRQDKSAESYLRVLLLHLGCGFSLRETIVHPASSGGLPAALAGGVGVQAAETDRATGAPPQT